MGYVAGFRPESLRFEPVVSIVNFEREAKTVESILYERTVGESQAPLSEIPAQLEAD